MDVNSLLIFAKVAESGSFTGAARLLNVPKSFVSQRVSRLEDELGLRLLQRTTRRISLTEEGLRILEMAGDIAEHVDEIRAFADRLSESPSGLLRISAPHDFGIYVIREILPGFLRVYPDVEVEMDLTNRFVDLVEEGFDLALRASGSPLRDSSLIAVRLADTALRFYCRADSQQKMPETLEDLATHPVISFRRPSRVRKTTLEVFSEQKKETLHVAGPLRTSDMLGCKHAVLAGLGIGLLPDFLVRPELHSGELVNVLPEWGAQPATFYAVQPSRRHVSGKAKVFIDHLKEVIGDRK